MEGWCGCTVSSFRPPSNVKVSAPAPKLPPPPIPHPHTHQPLPAVLAQATGGCPAAKCLYLRMAGRSCVICVFAGVGGELEISETDAGWGWWWWWWWRGGGVIDLISCARRPIEGCRFSRFRPLYPQHLLGRFILGGKG